MLGKVLIAQVDQPDKQNWAEEVQKDLKDFQIVFSFEYMFENKIC